MSEQRRGCNGCSGCCCHKQPTPISLDETQKQFLLELTLHEYLPVTRFIRTNSVNDDVYIIALAPVYLVTAEDSIETVKQTGSFLLDMEKAGLITLDYGAPLDGYPYLEYTRSSLFAYFSKTVCEGAECNPDFLGDTPHLELGSIAITDLGRRSLSIS